MSHAEQAVAATPMATQRHQATLSRQFKSTHLSDALPGAPLPCPTGTASVGISTTSALRTAGSEVWQQREATWHEWRAAAKMTGCWFMLTACAPFAIAMQWELAVPAAGWQALRWHGTPKEAGCPSRLSCNLPVWQVTFGLSLN